MSCLRVALSEEASKSSTASLAIVSSGSKPNSAAARLIDAIFSSPNAEEVKTLRAIISTLCEISSFFVKLTPILLTSVLKSLNDLLVVCGLNSAPNNISL